VPVDFFAALGKAMESPASAVTVNSVRDAGFHAGQALFDAFTSWLGERGERTPDTLDDVRFGVLADEFFTELGWGSFRLTSLSDSVMTLDSDDWGESDIHGTGCHVTTGMFAGFFGRVADAPIAVLEVECRAGSEGRCRFLLGSVDVLGYVHEAMGRGIPYDRAAASA
jgi:hypothetical protein